MIDLIFVALYLVITGSLYSYIIYRHPPKEGRTWKSVSLGVLITEIGIIGATWIIFRFYGVPVTVWYWLIGTIGIAYGITGGLMIYGQELKKRDEDRLIEEHKNEKRVAPKRH